LRRRRIGARPVVVDRAGCEEAEERVGRTVGFFYGEEVSGVRVAHGPHLIDRQRAERDRARRDQRTVESAARRFERHCCVERKSDTTPALGEASRVCEPSDTPENAPHKSPI
jgi:hypothetical protein